MTGMSVRVLSVFVALSVLASVGVVTSACSSSSSEADGTPEGLSPTRDAGESPSDPTDTTDSGSPKDDGEAPTTPPTSSRGTGGLSCTSTQKIANERTLCVTKVGSVELKILVPENTTGAYRLGFYLHGDGAAAHKSGSALAAMEPWSDAQHGIGVSVLAPNGCSWWQAPSLDCSDTQVVRDTAAANTAALADAVQALLGAYDIRLDGFFYYGSSGGSVFFTDQWIPIKGAAYPGVFALMCGGTKPTQPFTWDTTDATIRDKSPLSFTYGDRDELVPDIEEAITDLGAKGFGIHQKVIPNAGHCEFDGHGEAMSIWNAAP